MIAYLIWWAIGIPVAFVWLWAGMYAVRLFDLTFAINRDDDTELRILCVFGGLISMAVAMIRLVAVRVKYRLSGTEIVVRLEPFVDFMRPVSVREKLDARREAQAHSQARALEKHFIYKHQDLIKRADRGGLPKGEFPSLTFEIDLQMAVWNKYRTSDDLTRGQRRVIARHHEAMLKENAR